MSPRHTEAIGRLVAAIEAILADSQDAARVAEPLAALVASDDWIDPAFAAPDPVRYRQYLLHRDPAERFSVVSFVWGPGQATPIHDHRAWGLVGVLRGAEIDQRYERAAVLSDLCGSSPSRLLTGKDGT